MRTSIFSAVIPLFLFAATSLAVPKPFWSSPSSSATASAGKPSAAVAPATANADQASTVLWNVKEPEVLKDRYDDSAELFPFAVAIGSLKAWVHFCKPEDYSTEAIELSEYILNARAIQEHINSKNWPDLEKEGFATILKAHSANSLFPDCTKFDGITSGLLDRTAGEGAEFIKKNKENVP